MNRLLSACILLVGVSASLLLDSCRKNDGPINNGNDAAAYSSDVLDKWMTLQLRLMKNATGIPNQAFSRHYAYSGIAALESIAPGLSPHTSSLRNWNGLTGLPAASHTVKYYYPANANASLAAINKAMFPNANAADKQAIDSLESALNNEFLATIPAERIAQSADFGKAVAAAVFNWAETDGYKDASKPFTVPTGDGFWKPVAPSTAGPATPYWGNNRNVVAGSLNNTQAPAPIAYSITPGSPFHNMVKEVYDASKSLTDDQKAMAIYWRDVPGVTSPGHWVSILQQVIKKHHARLDKAVLAYALSGAAVNDALITCWKSKYQYFLLRPATYIRDIMGHTWDPYITTPGHPEYSSAHSALSGAAAAVIEKIFGNGGSFTDHTYDYLGFPSRPYQSIMAIAEEAGLSRFYAGIHYKPSIDAGLNQGKKVANNIFHKQLQD